MEKEELNRIVKYWVDNIRHLVDRINMAAIDDNAENIIAGYKSIMSIQPESRAYQKFNKEFNALVLLIKNNFIFEPEHNKFNRILQPDLKNENYDEWYKLRIKIIDKVNQLEKEFEFIKKKYIKSKIDVLGVKPKYDNQDHTIYFKNHPIKTKNATLEQRFCDYLFNKMEDEQIVSWDEIFEEIGSPENSLTDRKKQIYDVQNLLNKKIQKKLNNNNAIICKWDNKSIRKTFYK